MIYFLIKEVPGMFGTEKKEVKKDAAEKVDYVIKVVNEWV